MPIQVPIAFCADKNYGAYVPVAAQSIIDNSSPAHKYDIIILDCGISKEIIAVLERLIAPHKNFTFTVKSAAAALDTYSPAFQVKSGQYLSPATYARLLLPELCGEYEKLIYADIDMVFNRDMAELMKIRLEGEEGEERRGEERRGEERRETAGILYCRRSRCLCAGMAGEENTAWAIYQRGSAGF